MVQAVPPGASVEADAAPRTDPVPAVQLVGVDKSYGLLKPRPALRGVSLRIARGECYGLAGPNGAGKTTLIKVMLGLVAPEAGEARLLGLRPESPEVRRRVGFVPESAELPPGATPLQLVKRWARLRRIPVAPALEQGEQHLRRLGMAELLGRPVHRFSKGEKQRTLLSLALLGEPELLVLDEPTDGLDPLGRALVRRVILEETAAGRTVFVNSHLLSETERVCNRVGILHRGVLVREEVLGKPGGEDLATTALVVAAPLPAELETSLGARRPAADQGAAHVYLLDHDGLDALNRAIDRLRGAGARIVEVRRVRRDLEETLTLVATAAPGEAPTSVDAGELVDARPPPDPALRGLRATFRVAREIASDLIARKMAHVSVAGAALVLLVISLVVRNQIVQGLAATARQFRAGGMFDDQQLAHLIGRGAAAGEYWALLSGSIFLSAMFAPPLLEQRRSTLLLAQPVSRADVAKGIFASVCLAACAIYTLFGIALFIALRVLGLPVTPAMMLVPLATTVAFSAIYALVLLTAYLFPSGILGGVVGVAALLALVIAGDADAAQPANAHGWAGFVFGLLPKLIGLHHQAMRLGSASTLSAFPFVSTLAWTAAVLLVVQLVARRSER